MYKRINLDKNKEVQIPLFTGINNFTMPDGMPVSEKLYKTSIYTDGDVFINEIKKISRENQVGSKLNEGEQAQVKQFFLEHQEIDEMEIAYANLRNPSFYVIVSVGARCGKQGKLFGRSFLLEGLEAYAVKPLMKDTVEKIKKTYEDIRGMVINRDASMFEYFLGKTQVFRLDYEKVEENVYQLKRGKVK